MKKFSELSTRLKIAKKIANKNSFTNDKKHTSSLGTAWKLSTEMVAAVFVGSIIGFILDNWFDSKPWLTIIFFFAGSAAGILNVIKSAKLMQKNNDKNWESEMSTNPMHQFNVYRIGPEISLGNVDISFTNASLFMMIVHLQ